MTKSILLGRRRGDVNSCLVQFCADAAGRSRWFSGQPSDASSAKAKPGKKREPRDGHSQRSADTASAQYRQSVWPIWRFHIGSSPTGQKVVLGPLGLDALRVSRLSRDQRTSCLLTSRPNARGRTLVGV
jgi:hypothetical protein